MLFDCWSIAVIAIPSTADDDSVKHVEDDLTSSEASVPSTTRSGGRGGGDVPTILYVDRLDRVNATD